MPHPVFFTEIGEWRGKKGEGIGERNWASRAASRVFSRRSGQLSEHLEQARWWFDMIQSVSGNYNSILPSKLIEAVPFN